MIKKYIEFTKEITKVKEQYINTNRAEEFADSLYSISNKYNDLFAVGDYLLNVGEECIAGGDYASGIAIIKNVERNFQNTYNTTLLFLRLAEYYIENSLIELGTEYLIKLCSSVSNYEESIKFNELSSVWQKYKHLVENKVPKSICVNSPKMPENCSIKIDEIFSLLDSEIIEKLSEHINELSANGDTIDLLNNQERIFYYIDELWMKVNSGGFEEYIYYDGDHFNEAYKAIEKINCFEMLSLMDSVKSKFNKKSLPKSLEKIQDALESMEKKGIDFDAEDSEFYDSVENKLSKSLLNFVLKNKKYFR